MKARVKQIKHLVEQTEMDYEREKLNERIARLAGGVAIIQVRGSTGCPLLAPGLVACGAEASSAHCAAVRHCAAWQCLADYRPLFDGTSTPNNNVKRGLCCVV